MSWKVGSGGERQEDELGCSTPKVEVIQVGLAGCQLAHLQKYDNIYIR